MRFKLPLLFLLDVLLLILPTNVLAFSFSIVGVDPSTLTSKEQEMIVNLSITDLPSGDSYFRVGWESGGSYVGYIRNNNGDWVKLGSLTSDKDSQGCLNYFKINTSTPSAELRIKIGSDIDLLNGNVNIKAHRFTSTCGSNTGSNLFVTAINLPTPSPTPTPLPTSEPTAVSTPTPTVMPTPTPTPTKKPTPKSTLTSKPEVLGDESVDSEPNLISSQNETAATPTPSGSQSSGKFPILAVVFILLGVGLVGFSVFSFVRGMKKGYTNGSENPPTQIS